MTSALSPRRADAAAAAERRRRIGERMEALGASLAAASSDGLAQGRLAEATLLFWARAQLVLGEAELGVVSQDLVGSLAPASLKAAARLDCAAFGVLEAALARAETALGWPTIPARRSAP